MTTVHVARIERRIPHGPVPDRFPTHVMVLADDPGRRELPIWLLGQDSHRFADDRHGPSSDELTHRLLRATGTRVTAVNVDELGPEVTVARVELATPAGPSTSRRAYTTAWRRPSRRVRRSGSPTRSWTGWPGRPGQATTAAPCRSAPRAT